MIRAFKIFVLLWMFSSLYNSGASKKNDSSIAQAQNTKKITPIKIQYYSLIKKIHSHNDRVPRIFNTTKGARDIHHLLELSIAYKYTKFFKHQDVWSSQLESSHFSSQQRDAPWISSNIPANTIAKQLGKV